MENEKIKIEGIEHEWLENSECEFFKCKKNAEVTWCDDCNIAFCKEHTEYYNDYEEGKTYCPECWKVKQKEGGNGIPPKPKVLGILPTII